MVGEKQRLSMEFVNYTVNVYVIESASSAVKELAYLRPLRLTKDNLLTVIYKQKAYPVVLNKESFLTCILDGSSYSPSDTKPIGIPCVKNIDYYEIPNEYISENVSWSIDRNQFGVYIYISAHDDAVENLVTSLIEKYKLRIINWGSADSEQNYQWRIKLSSGLSIDTVRTAMHDLITHWKKDYPTAVDANIPNNKNPTQKDDITKTHKKIKNSNKQKTQHETVSQESEIDSLYEELDRLLKENDEIKKKNHLLLNSTKKNEPDVSKYKRDAADKLLANFIFSSYSNLAFSPQTIDILKGRFSESKSIWDVLIRLNNGDQLRLERLNGIAGRVGWCELRMHINTGSDNRGRIYCRKSQKRHLYDVILHWKKDNKEQNRILKKLATYQPFESTDTIFM